MGRTLLAEEPAFDRAVRECDAAAEGCFERPLRDFLSGEAERGGPGYRPAALAAFCIGAGASLAARGVAPGLHLGCSVGEIAALAMTGMVSRQHAFRFIAAQAAALARHAPSGALLFALAEPEIEDQVAGWPDAALAGVYAPGLVLVAVGEAELAGVLARLEALGAMVQPLPVAAPVHGPLIEGARDAILRAAGEVAWARGGRVLSSATAERVTGGATHLWRICRDPIRFRDGVCRAAREGLGFAIDIGPSGALATAARRATGAAIDCAAVAPGGLASAAALDRVARAVTRHRG